MATGGQGPGRSGHEVHFITYTQPVRLGSFHPRVFYHEVRSKYPLFDYPPYELVLTSKMVEVATAYARLVACALRHPPRECGVECPADFGQTRASPPCGHHPARHRHHPARPGRVVQAVHLRRHRGKHVVTAVSDDLKPVSLKTFGEHPIEVVPNFICPSHFQREPNASFKEELSPSGAPVLCHVSNFRPGSACATWWACSHSPRPKKRNSSWVGRPRPRSGRAARPRIEGRRRRRVLGQSQESH